MICDIENLINKIKMGNSVITQWIKDNNVFFDSYRQGVFYYKILAKDIWWIFPVSETDIGTATLLNKDKAITFMRWIRKAMEEKTMVASAILTSEETTLQQEKNREERAFSLYVSQHSDFTMREDIVIAELYNNFKKQYR